MQDPQTSAPLAYAPPKLPAVIGLCRSMVYAKIRSGEIRSVRCGRRILVPAEAVKEFLASLPAGGPKA